MSRDGFVAHCLELLAPLGAARARRMFGGHGLYVDDVFIALIAFDRLFLKADAATQPRFAAAGCEPFVYDTSDGQRVVMSFMSAPEEATESPALMLPWARLALEAGLRARAAKAARPARAGAGRKAPQPGTPARKADRKAPAQRAAKRPAAKRSPPRG